MDEYFLSFFFCFVNSFSALDLLRTQLVCPTLLQFFMNHSETLQASFSWSVDVHVTKGFGQIFITTFSQYELVEDLFDSRNLLCTSSSPVFVFHNHFETFQASSTLSLDMYMSNSLIILVTLSWFELRPKY